MASEIDIDQIEFNLRPCPCCGTQEIDRKKGLELANSYMYFPDSDGGESKCIYDDWCVVCHFCGLQTRKFNKPEDAARAWNRRVEDDNWDLR